MGSLFLLIIQSFYPMSMFHCKSVLVVILYFQPIYAAGPKVYLFVRRYLDPYPFGQSLYSQFPFDVQLMTVFNCSIFLVLSASYLSRLVGIHGSSVPRPWWEFCATWPVTESFHPNLTPHQPQALCCLNVSVNLLPSL